MNNLEEIRSKLTEYKELGKELFATSSFQTHSIVMLHVLSRIDKEIPVKFINTGYLFPETITYKEEVAELFGLRVDDVKSSLTKYQQRDASGKLLFASDPDYCCFLNKTQPMEPLLGSNSVWINGIRADQNANRKNMKPEQSTPQGALRYHPMLNWTGKMIYEYINEFNLPRHPLDEKGYMSIGCEPCTIKVSGESRDGRWFGMNKTECGLHTDLVANN